LVFLPPVATSANHAGSSTDCTHLPYHPDRRTLGAESCADRTFFDEFYRDDVDMTDPTSVENKMAIDDHVNHLMGKGKSRARE